MHKKLVAINREFLMKFCFSVMICSRLSNMKLCALLLVIILFSSLFGHPALGSNLPDPKFMADLVTYLNRLGIIFHLPPIEKSTVYKYRKSISQYR